MIPSLRDPSRPFFMQWPDADWPGVEPVQHRVPVGEIVGLEVSGPDRDAFDHWTLGADLPLLVEDGPADLIAVTLEVDGRPWRLGGDR